MRSLEAVNTGKFAAGKNTRAMPEYLSGELASVPS